jgi:uncharacterized LabA/DUF88 family protein
MTTGPSARVRAVLYVDFDNVFSGMLGVDRSAALTWAQSPSSWVEELTTKHQLEGPRTWLIRRCYLNPSGSVADPHRPDSRFFFSRFRSSFTRAGFEVIDCPSLTNRAKNAADIRMAIDVLDALAAPTTYDEFVVASSDSDFTPLLQRIRAEDRRVTVLSSTGVVPGYQAVADQYLDIGAFCELMGIGPPRPEKAGPTDELAFERFRVMIEEAYVAATEPLLLSQLAQTAREQIGPVVDDSDWFGHHSFKRAIRALGLSGAEFDQHVVYNRNLHDRPSARTAPDSPIAPVLQLKGKHAGRRRGVVPFALEQRPMVPWGDGAAWSSPCLRNQDTLTC